MSSLHTANESLVLHEGESFLQEWEYEDAAVEDASLPAVPCIDVADARELLSRPAEENALFSAEAAGVQPPGLMARAAEEGVFDADGVAEPVHDADAHADDNGVAAS